MVVVKMTLSGVKQTILAVGHYDSYMRKCLDLKGQKAGTGLDEVKHLQEYAQCSTSSATLGTFFNGRAVCSARIA
ncbi:hypothetical protein D3C85_1047930 [compost metagenome]